MTNLCSTSPALDLPTLDGTIRLHLQAHARRNGLADRFAQNAGETSAVASLILIDPNEDLFAGRAEALMACRMFRHGFEAALSLAVVASRAPFCPNDRAIAAVLAGCREDIEATLADDRARWAVPA